MVQHLHFEATSQKLCSRTLFLLVYVCPGSVISLSAFVGSTAGCPPVLLVTFDLDSSLIVPSPPPGTLEVLSDHDSFCKAILVIPRACHLLSSAKQHETTTTVNTATLKTKQCLHCVAGTYSSADDSVAKL